MEVSSSMRWYYLSETQETIPTTEDQLPLLASQGLIRPTTALWRTGLVGWASAGELQPGLFSGPLPVEATLRKPSHRVAEGIGSRAIWVTLAGAFAAVLGLVGAISVLAATVGKLRLQANLPQVGPVAQKSLLEEHGANLLTNPTLLVLEGGFATLTLLLLAVAGVYWLLGGLACRASWASGTLWKLENGLHHLGRGFFWLACAGAAGTLGLVILGILRAWAGLEPLSMGA